MLYDVEVRENNTQEFDDWVGDYTEAERLTVKELKKYDINKIYNISAEDDKIYICF